MNMPINSANLKNNLTALAKNWIKKLPVRRERKYECLCTLSDREHETLTDRAGRGIIVREKGNPNGQLYFVDSGNLKFKYEGVWYYLIGPLAVLKLRSDFPIQELSHQIDAWDIKDVIPFFDGRPEQHIEDDIRQDRRYEPIAVQNRRLAARRDSSSQLAFG